MSLFQRLLVLETSEPSRLSFSDFWAFRLQSAWLSLHSYFISAKETFPNPDFN